MKIVTWNVNGIRSRKNLGEVFKTLAADIYCIQETKISKEQIEENVAFVNNNYYSCFAIPKQMGFRGRSGCATYYLDSARPYKAEYGFFDEENCSSEWKEHLSNLEHIGLDEIKNLDSEGRVMITCHEIKISGDIRKLFIINVYFPRLDPDKEGRAEFKDKFNRMIEQKVEHYLEDTKSNVIVLCDLNIEHKEIDTFDPPKKGFDDDMYRIWLTKFLTPKTEGRHMVDSFRKVFPNKKRAFTCWPAMIPGARERNNGARIDCIFVDSQLAKHICKVDHLTQVMGSDHCPVSVEFENVELIASKNQPNGCTRTWLKFSKRQPTILSFITIKPNPVQCNKDYPIKLDNNNTATVRDIEIVEVSPKVTKEEKNDTVTLSATPSPLSSENGSRMSPSVVELKSPQTAFEKLMLRGSQGTSPQARLNLNSKTKLKPKSKAKTKRTPKRNASHV